MQDTVKPGRTPRSAPKSPTPLATDAALNQTVYDTLFDAILGGTLPPGAKLAEAQLCAQFGVSRTVVRQALHRLSELHIVHIVPNKGATVAAPTPQEALEVFEARRAVEEAIIKRLAQRISHSELERLRLRLAAEHSALHGQDHARWVMLAGGFHLALAQMAGNTVLLRMLTELLTRCSLIVALYEPPGNAHCEHAEHERLVDLLALRDGEAAARLMGEHLDSLQARLKIQRS
ncbi:GntR family transcriptional regulator [Rhodoferax lacus]|uniref:GntR family transcriptional regulator n=1 Tax=Rhodoferax lacus TaxID=2184758 RepID=A0A3E1RBC0_9BURK|nr:GntR family transcriptional regulator [Rhodoferax lacus]RFO96511.1 GntR family transcriptional regulator [Rhodoferax lacus]